jgi:hypothetical protein
MLLVSIRVPPLCQDWLAEFWPLACRMEFLRKPYPYLQLEGLVAGLAKSGVYEVFTSIPQRGWIWEFRRLVKGSGHGSRCALSPVRKTSPTESANVVECQDWILTGWDINKDIPITDMLQLSAPDIQLKEASRVFRVYIKSLGDKAVCK